MSIEKAKELSGKDEALLYLSMSKEDALEVTIKGAIFIESQLIGYIEEHVASKKFIDRMNLTFEDRVNLAIALGLRETLQPPLKAMATIRNKFAHQTDATITKVDIDNFHNTFVADDKQAVEKTYQRTRKKTNTKRPSRFKSQPLLDQYVHYILTLRGALIAERVQKPSKQ